MKDEFYCKRFTNAEEVIMKHYKQGRLDEAAEREGQLIQSFSPD